MRQNMDIVKCTVWLALVICVAAAPKRHERHDIEAERAKKQCGGKPAELFFLVDSSSSIWIVNYKKQLKFVNDVIDNFDIGPDKTRIGVATFSDRFDMHIRLDDYADDKEGLMKAVNNTRYLKGGTFTHEALEQVRTIGFDPKVVRQGVAHIAIVMTDGESSNKEETIKQAELLKKAGVYIFAVGIGDRVNLNELRNIASDPDDEFVWEVADFNVLDRIKNKLAYKACEVQEQRDQPMCGGRNFADVIFMMDSATLGATKTATINSFVGDVVSEFNAAGDHIRVGVESRICHNQNIRLDEYKDKLELADALRISKVPGLNSLLRRLHVHSYQEEHGGRNAARHMAVLFIDDKLDNAKEVLAEAMEAKLQDIEVFVVAVGDKVDADELTALCSHPADQHVLRVSSYDELALKKPEFLEKFCHGL